MTSALASKHSDSAKIFNRHFATNRKSIQHVYLAAIETEFGDPATKVAPRFRVSDFRNGNE
jgi:hypothetical protein